MKKLVSILIAGLLAVLFVTGCGSITVKDIDSNTGKVIRETTSTGTGVIITSTKDKAVIVWGDGISMSGSISPGTTDNPMPHVEGSLKNGNGGVALVPKDMPSEGVKGVAEIIKSTKSSSSISATKEGVSVSGSEKSKDSAVASLAVSPAPK